MERREDMDRGTGVIVKRRERAEMEGEVEAQLPTDLVARGAAIVRLCEVYGEGAQRISVELDAKLGGKSTGY